MTVKEMHISWFFCMQTEPSLKTKIEIPLEIAGATIWQIILISVKYAY
jgi:hypothetical protein